MALLTCGHNVAATQLWEFGGRRGGWGGRLGQLGGGRVGRGMFG